MRSRNVTKRYDGRRSSRFSQHHAAMEMLEPRLLLDGAIVDLVVSDAVLDQRSVIAGQIVTIDVTTSNLGIAPASPGGGATDFKTTLFLRGDKQFDPLVTADIVAETPYASMAALGSDTATLTFTAPTAPGRYWLAVMADKDLNVSEANDAGDAETNNWSLLVELYVHNAPVVVTPIADIDLLTGAPASVLDLAARFNDPDITGTVYRFTSNRGVFDVHMFDADTPATVANFGTYASAGDYVDTIIHRSIPGFIVQAGGFTVSAAPQLGYVPQYDPVVNEPVFSNIRGTIAMAKLGDDPNSATNQWFFNLEDNSANLDNQNGGFTAFGEVIGTGMDVPDAIAGLTIWDGSSIHSAWTDLPLIDYAPPTSLVQANFVFFPSIAQTDPLVFEVVGNTNEALVGTAIAADGTLTLTYAPGVTGTAEISILVTDLAGGTVTETFDVSVEDPDTTAPVVSINPLTTAYTRPSLIGRVNDPTAVVTVTIDGQTYEAVNHGTTWWRLDNDVIAPPLAAGTYDVLVEATDGAGNVGTDATTEDLFIVLTIAPDAPVLQAASDTGALSDDNITMLNNALQFEVSGTLAGANVTLYADGVAIGNALATGTTVTVTTTAALADGVSQITVRQNRGGELPSADSAALAVTVDTVAPTASRPDLAAGSDSGVSDSDDITRGEDPVFDGTASDGGGSGVWKVDVTSDDGKSGTDSEAPFYSVVLATLDEGSRSVTATVFDIAGNSFTTAALVVTVDRSPVVLTWDGQDGANWTSDHWNPGLAAPAGGEVMVVDSGTVVVTGDLTVTPGAAASLDIASGAAGGTVSLAVGSALAVSGDVSVGAGGSLIVDGVLTAPTVTLSGGRLSNSPNSAAPLTIEGNVSLADGATFASDAVMAGVDTLTTQGSVTLGDSCSLEIVVSGGGNEFRSGVYTLIHAAGGLSGTFSNVIVPPGYVSVNGNGLTYDYDAGTVTLTLDMNLNPADGNLDGATDVGDRIIWNNYNFQEGTTFATGDYNNDGATDVSDRIIWNDNNFTEAIATPIPQAAPVASEPTGDADAQAGAYLAQVPAAPQAAPAPPDDGEATGSDPVVTVVEATTSDAPTVEASSPQSELAAGAAPEGSTPAESQLEPDIQTDLPDALGDPLDVEPEA